MNCLADLVGASPSAVSQHLAKLRRAGLVTVRREGTVAYYAAANSHVQRILDEALSHAEHATHRVDSATPPQPPGAPERRSPGSISTGRPLPVGRPGGSGHEAHGRSMSPESTELKKEPMGVSRGHRGERTAGLGEGHAIRGNRVVVPGGTPRNPTYAVASPLCGGQVAGGR